MIDAEKSAHTDGKPLHALLVGIAGTSRDLLLGPPTLKAFVLQNPRIAARTKIEVLHHKYILPSLRAESCAKIVDQILSFKPDLIGFSTYVWNIEAVSCLAAACKVALPGSRIVLGGPEVAVTSISAGKFDNLHVDFLIGGEGEIPFEQLLLHFLEPAHVRLDAIPRLCCRGDDGLFNARALEDMNAAILPDLSRIPSPYLTGGFPASWLKQSGVQASIETQRGCNFRCAYCLYHSHFPSIRYHDPKTVLAELQYVNDQGIEHCRVTDANFLSDRNHAAAILRGMVERRLEMSLFVEVIPSFLDPTIADLIREYRSVSSKNEILVGIGLQSINPDSLRSIRRRLPQHHFDNAYSLLSAAGAVVKTDIILGLPHETLETYIRLLDYVAEKLHGGANWLSLALLRILPGTELEAVAEREKLVLDERDREHFVYATPTLPRPDMITALRLSTVAFRVLHAPDTSNIHVREAYFSAKTTIGASHPEMLMHLADFFSNVLDGTSADYVKDDFPNAEHYWSFDVFKDISDHLILGELERIQAQGLASRHWRRPTEGRQCAAGCSS